MNQKLPHPTFFAPLYFLDFHCIADKCRHSCCVDWDICIDENTLSKYQSCKDIMSTVTECDGNACFALREDGRCPHLDEQGLCRIILSHGEELLSDICRRHPRFFNHVGGGRIEVGLGIVCEEACRLILEDPRRFALVQIEENGLDFEASMEEDTPFCGYDPLPAREEILTLIRTFADSYENLRASLAEAFAIPDLTTPDEWLRRLLSLEILDMEWEKTLLSAIGKAGQAPPPVPDSHSVRLLTYFVYRHVSVASHHDNLRARLAFALLSVDIIRRLLAVGDEQTPAAFMDLARRYSTEIEYSEENTDELIFLLECRL